MKPFSIRQGLMSEKRIQLEDMDQELRNGLWNILHLFFWTNTKRLSIGGLIAKAQLKSTVEKAWLGFFKWRLNSIPWEWSKIETRIEVHYNDMPWNKIYEFIEFMAPLADDIARGNTAKFVNACNAVLEKEKSAYRFVGKIISPLTNEAEISEVENALTTPHITVNLQIKSALEKLADRGNPDYRNSIKESISAVETVVKLIADDANTTLGPAVDRIKNKLNLHNKLVDGLKSLYHYTSDAEGIRHALMDKPNLNSDDARFMLVSCSAFANYLLRLAEQAGILTSDGN